MNKIVPVGLLTPSFSPLTGYEKNAQALGIKLVVVVPSKIRWASGQVEALILQEEKWIKRITSLPKAFYNRFYGPKPPVVDALEKIIGKDQVFNHVTQFDKLKLHAIFENSALQEYMPSTSLFSPDTLQEYLEKYSAAILKPRYGHLGYQILLVRTDHNGYHLHHGSKHPTASFNNFQKLSLTLSKSLSSNCIIQKFIPFSTLNDRIFDVRALVQKDSTGTWQVSGLVSRVALSYSYITNISVAIIPGEEALKEAYPHTDYISLLRKISVKGAQIAEQSLGSLGEISVDFALDRQGKVWIIELNGKPTKAVFKKLDNGQILERVYQTPLEYARYLATK